MSTQDRKALEREYDRLIEKAEAALIADEDIGPIYSRIGQVLRELNDAIAA